MSGVSSPTQAHSRGDTPSRVHSAVEGALLVLDAVEHFADAQFAAALDGGRRTPAGQHRNVMPSCCTA